MSSPHTRIRGSWALSASDELPIVADTKRRSFVDFDEKTFQRRLSFGIPADEIPIFSSTKSNGLITFAIEDNKRWIKHYGASRKYPDDKVELLANVKAAQDHSNLVFLNYESDKQLLSIIERPYWSGVSEEKTYTIPWPKEFNYDKSKIDLNLVNRRMIIYGASPKISQTFGKIFIYNYAKGIISAGHSVDKAKVIEWVDDSPNGRFYAILIQNKNDHKTENLKIYDLNNKKWVTVTL